MEIRKNPNGDTRIHSRRWLVKVLALIALGVTGLLGGCYVDFDHGHHDHDHHGDHHDWDHHDGDHHDHHDGHDHHH